jgi:hypothetical protein
MVTKTKEDSIPEYNDLEIDFTSRFLNLDKNEKIRFIVDKGQPTERVFIFNPISGSIWDEYNRRKENPDVDVDPKLWLVTHLMIEPQMTPQQLNEEAVGLRYWLHSKLLEVSFLLKTA